MHVSKQVLLARGAALPPSTGFGRAHHSLEEILQNDMVPGWSRTSTIEHQITRSPLTRLLKRWRNHPALVSTSASNSDADILHITDQEQAHLTPSNGKIPTVVTVHDLFHLEPREIESGGTEVQVGEKTPGPVRRMDLKRMREGLQRADLLICISEMTLRDVQGAFPGKPTAIVRNQIDIGYWSPFENPKSRELLSEFTDPSKCLLITVGNNEPRKRIDFVREAISSLPTEVSRDIHLLNIGSETKLSNDQLVAAYQHAEALLFPSYSEGFGYPPAEAMAAGCRVMAADLPAHNEFIPERCLLPPANLESWMDEIVDVHSKWKNTLGDRRTPDDSLIEHIRARLSPEERGKALSVAYESALQARGVSE